MQSLATSFRAAARRAQWRAPTLATPRRANSADSPTSLGEISNMFRHINRADSPEPVIPGAEPAAAKELSKGDVRTRGFWENSFQKPLDYTYKERTKGRSPHKLPLLGPSAAESRRLDVFHQLGIDPLHECQNSALLSRFVTDMGKIQSRAHTKLTWKNQRRMGKAIRRAKMMGIIPILSRRSLDYGFLRG